MRDRIGALIWVVALVFIVTGCAGAGPKAQSGAVAGTVIGAGTGAGIGYALAGPEGAAMGALAGAAFGGVAGYTIGDYMDRQEQELRQSLANVHYASVQRDQDLLAVTFRADLLFDYDSAVIKPGAYQELDRVAYTLTRYPETRIQVQGHTDSTGSEQYNMNLSRSRAESVAQALVQRGVHPQRIQAVPMGESRPVATNATEAGRQMNRRVQIVIIPVQG